MKKSEKSLLYQYCGDPSGVFGIKDYTFNDGRSKGIRAFDLKNGQGLELTILADRGLDISYLGYKGYNIGFLSKTGIPSPNFFVENGLDGFLKQFFAGFLTTGGISHSGPPKDMDGKHSGLHGILNNTPAEGVNAYVDESQEDMKLCVSGSVREASVFGYNLYMHRKLTLDTESNRLFINDTIENRGFAPSPVKMLYHINFGYPMLDESCHIYTSSQKIVPRDEQAQSGLYEYNKISHPVIGYQEQCFFHLEGTDKAFAMIHNKKLGIAAIVHYDRSQCPLLCQWKSMAAGDYALGLEPTSAGVFNHEEQTRYLDAGESYSYEVSVEFTDDIEVIKKYIEISQ